MRKLKSFIRPNKDILILLLGFMMIAYSIAIFANSILPMAVDGNYSMANMFTGIYKYLASFVRFDSAHYINIVANGYDNKYPFLFAFFPLYPIILSAFAYLPSLLIGKSSSITLSIILTSPALLIIGFWLYKKVLLLDLENSAAAKGLVLLIAYPFAFFYLAGYTESLFLLLIVATIYMARKRVWWAAGLLAVLASATRLPGLLLGLF